MPSSYAVSANSLGQAIAHGGVLVLSPPKMLYRFWGHRVTLASCVAACLSFSVLTAA